MANIVIQVSAADIEKMKKYYKNFITNKTPPGGVFMAKKDGCTITAYKSGKVMFQGAGNQEESSRWGKAESKKQAMKQVKVSPRPYLPPNISSMSLIGSDEVGKGDYFGPLTVVAAYVNKDQLALLQELGVKDSKNLSDHQITGIAKDIISFLPYSSLTLSNEKYNEVQAAGMTQGKITALLHNQAINHLIRKIAPEKPEAVLIDQFAKEQIYYQHLRNEQEVYRENVYFSPKAEGIHLAVAAASIIARYSFLLAIERLSEKAGFTIPKGAGPAVDNAAARLIRSKGVGSLNEFTKLHFANTGKAKAIAGAL